MSGFGFNNTMNERWNIRDMDDLTYTIKSYKYLDDTIFLDFKFLWLLQEWWQENDGWVEDRQKMYLFPLWTN